MLTDLTSSSPFAQSDRPIPAVPKDRLLAELIKKHSDLIWKFHDHDSLLENQVDENLSEADRKAAWEEFENEKKGFVNFGNAQLQNQVMQNINPQDIQVGGHRRQQQQQQQDKIVRTVSCQQQLLLDYCCCIVSLAQKISLNYSFSILV